MASLTEMVEAALEGEGNVNFRSFGRDGFDKHRPFIWRLLLNVVVGKDDLFKKQRSFNYHERRLTSDIARFIRASTFSFSTPPLSNCSSDSFDSATSNVEELSGVIHSIVSVYLNQTRTEYDSKLIYLAAPFVAIQQNTHDAYYCLVHFNELLDDYFSVINLQQRVANLWNLIRYLYPNLSNHFQDEMISMNDFSNWFSHLLSRQINTDNLYRLWDYYLSNGISDHVYICLAIIGNFSEMIEDMENGSEIRGFINRISVFDVDWVIGNALEIKVQLARNGIVVFE